MARHRAALRLTFGATLALVWGTMAREPLPGLTAVLAAQILVGMPRPPRPGQAAALVAVIAGTGGLTFAVGAAFAERLLILAAVLGLLFFVGFAMRDRAAGRPSLPATMLLNATAVVPVLTVQADILGVGVVETLVTAAARAMLVVWLLYALLPAPQEEAATSAPTGAAPATGVPVTKHSGAARTLAKVAIVLPAELFYLTEPSALAFPALLGLVTFLSAQDPAAGRAQLVILLLGNLVGSIAAAAASAVLEVGPPLPVLTLMALLGSLGFAGWIMTQGGRPGGSVALTGLVTFLMLFGLSASPLPFEVPVLDRIVDIGVLSLYTIGATALLLPPPEPRWPAPPRAARPPVSGLSRLAARSRNIQTIVRKIRAPTFRRRTRPRSIHLLAILHPSAFLEGPMADDRMRVTREHNPTTAPT
jgi:hypothetical protein